MKIRKWGRRGICVMTALMLLGICGCKKEVVTVTSSLDGEEDAEYIEMKELELKEVPAANGREDVSYCAVMIPEGYHESEEVPGMYVQEMAPLDSSNIYYSSFDGTGDGYVSDSLTEKEYLKIMEDALEESGQEGSIQIESFEETSLDEVPAYKIRSTYQLGDNTVQQLTYLVMAEDTYTITYSQADDDELMADFDISDGEIRLVKDDEVQTASNK